MPNLPPEMKTLSIQTKNCSKIEIELFPYCTISHKH